MFSWANFRARLPRHVRKLEKVSQRSSVALAVVREIADRRCARSADAQIRLPTKSASTKRPFHLQHIANLKNLLGMMSSLFPHPPRWVGLFKLEVKRRFNLAKSFKSV
jgi:hypothetical protein